MASLSLSAPDADPIPSLLQWLHAIGPGLAPGAAQAVSEGAQTLQAAAGGAVAQLDMAALLALAAALGWASGLRLYAITFLVGLTGAAQWLALPAGLQVLQEPVVLAVSAFMLLVEFFADKTPWLDSAWDAIHAFIRVPAGALLAAGVFGADSTAMGVAAGLLGGSLAATSFAAKATARAAINTSPEPFSNWGASLFEDGLAVFVLWLAITHPMLFGLLLVLMVAAAVLIVALLFRFFQTVLHKLRRQRPMPQGQAHNRLGPS